MRTYLDCIPCFFSQALRAGRMATEDENKIKKLLDEIGLMLKDIPLKSTPPETGMLIYRKVREITGVFDPYKEIKRESTEEALALYPSLKSEVEKSNDKLLTAIRIAIAGNVIDFGVGKDFNVREEIGKTLKKDFAIFDYDKFRYYLDKTDEILYLGDNAGESVFDRILIEEMKKPVIYVVREIPVINDVTYEDAIQAGIDKVASIISSGTNAPGTVLETCNAEFKEVYKNSKFVISKGQGNYEGLSEEKHPVFFLLKAKCRIIANDIGVREGDIILKGINI
ncbi:MAG: ARMT1-like domain-containing protein [Bacteroidales bacterium]|nr:ARMT1-like domain-containing protein [Bacteroidales bacterium]